MAKKPVDTSFIIGSAKALAEARRQFKIDDDRRTASGSLLHPDDVAGEYDVGRGLLTMMGGAPRELTIEDLREFDRISKRAAGKLKKGINAKGIIDLSMAIDRKRANDEIRTAVPISTTGGQIRFMTDSGPNSDRSRHYVTVNVMNFTPIMASAIKVERTGQELSKSPLQISCSCGRWRYWLAYLATTGGYNSGHAEGAFPKIRNPGLSGIACKHILRVMGAIHQSPYMKQYMTSMVKKAREKVDVSRSDEKVADTRAAAEEIKKESWRQNQIKSTEEKRAGRQKKAASEALKTTPKPKKATAPTRRAGSAKADARAIERIAASRGITPEQLIALLPPVQ